MKYLKCFQSITSFKNLNARALHDYSNIRAYLGVIIYN